jgi:preprotein translocase subunit SecE
MMRNKKTTISFTINIVITLLLFTIIYKVTLGIEHGFPKATLNDKLYVVLTYIVGFVILYYIANIIYGKWLKNKTTSCAYFMCLFLWIVDSLISIVRVIH